MYFLKILIKVEGENKKLMENTSFLPIYKQKILIKAYLRKCIALAWKGQL